MCVSDGPQRNFNLSFVCACFDTRRFCQHGAMMATLPFPLGIPIQRLHGYVIGIPSECVANPYPLATLGQGVPVICDISALATYKVKQIVRHFWNTLKHLNMIGTFLKLFTDTLVHLWNNLGHQIKMLTHLIIVNWLGNWTGKVD